MGRKKKLTQSGEELQLTIRGEVVKTLRSLAPHYGVDPDDLAVLISRGIKLLILARDGEKVIVETSTERITFDPKKV